MAFNNAVDANQQGTQYLSTVGVWTGLDGSTAGRVLTSNGTGVAPSFQTGATNTPTTAWVPNVQFGGAQVGIVYGLQQGWYTQVGDVVTAYFNVQLVNKGVSVGIATISNLPVTAGASNSGTVGTMQVNAFIFPVGNTYITSTIQTFPGTELQFSGNGSGVLGTILTNANFVNGCGFGGVIIYTVN